MSTTPAKTPIQAPLDLCRLSKRALRSLMARASHWGVTPAEAAQRILEQASAAAQTSKAK